MDDETRRSSMAGDMEKANAAERRPHASDIDRLRAARRSPEPLVRTRPGSLGPGEAEALIGEQLSVRHDDPLGSYGYGKQRPIGVIEDRAATLGSALKRAGDERATREAPVAAVAPNETEVIDPRDRLGQRLGGRLEP
jgi:hypothetical protein